MTRPSNPVRADTLSPHFSAGLDPAKQSSSRGRTAAAFLDRTMRNPHRLPAEPAHSFACTPARVRDDAGKRLVLHFAQAARVEIIEPAARRPPELPLALRNLQKMRKSRIFRGDS